MPNPFEIVTDNGDRAEAETEAGALLAVRTLRQDATRNLSLVPPTVHVLYEGRHVITVTPEMKP